jgi:hypothetical protein
LIVQLRQSRQTLAAPGPQHEAVKVHSVGGPQLVVVSTQFVPFTLNSTLVSPFMPWMLNG